MIDTLPSALALAPAAASSTPPRAGADAASADTDPIAGNGLFAKALAKARQPGAPADGKAPRQDVLPRESKVSGTEPEAEPRLEPTAAGSDELSATAPAGLDAALMAAVWPAPAAVTPVPAQAPPIGDAAVPVDGLQLQPGAGALAISSRPERLIDEASAAPLATPVPAATDAAAVGRGAAAMAQDALASVDPQPSLAANAARAGRAMHDIAPAAAGEAGTQATAQATAPAAAANEADRSPAQALASEAAVPGAAAATLAAATQPAARAAPSTTPVEAAGEGDEPSPWVATAALPARPQRAATAAATATAAAAAATRANAQTASDAASAADSAARGAAAAGFEARQAGRDDTALPVAAAIGSHPAAAAAPAPVQLPAAGAPLPAAAGAGMPTAAASAPAHGAEAPPFTAQLSPHVASPAFAPALGVQLTMLVKNGIGQAQLNLNPADMGPIAVRIELDGRQAQVMLAADHLQTRGVLEQALPSLASAMNDAGFTLSGGGVSQQGAWAGQNGQDGSSARSGSARSRAGDVTSTADDGVIGTRQVLPGPRGLVDLVA